MKMGRSRIEGPVIVFLSRVSRVVSERARKPSRLEMSFHKENVAS